MKRRISERSDLTYNKKQILKLVSYELFGDKKNTKKQKTIRS